MNDYPAQLQRQPSGAKLQPHALNGWRGHAFRRTWLGPQSSRTPHISRSHSCTNNRAPCSTNAEARNVEQEVLLAKQDAGATAASLKEKGELQASRRTAQRRICPACGHAGSPLCAAQAHRLGGLRVQLPAAKWACTLQGHLPAARLLCDAAQGQGHCHMLSAKTSAHVKEPVDSSTPVRRSSKAGVPPGPTDPNSNKAAMHVHDSLLWQKQNSCSSSPAWASRIRGRLQGLLHHRPQQGRETKPASTEASCAGGSAKRLWITLDPTILGSK